MEKPFLFGQRRKILLFPGLVSSLLQVDLLVLPWLAIQGRGGASIHLEGEAVLALIWRERRG